MTGEDERLLTQFNTPETERPTKTILVVDDDPDARRIASTILASEGYGVLEAETAERALDTIRNRRVDLVILDLALPGTPGLELLATLRRHHDLPVLIISGNDDVNTRIVGLRVGADDFVVKPVAPGEISAASRSPPAPVRTDSARRHTRIRRHPHRPRRATGLRPGTAHRARTKRVRPLAVLGIHPKACLQPSDASRKSLAVIGRMATTSNGDRAHSQAAHEDRRQSRLAPMDLHRAQHGISLRPVTRTDASEPPFGSTADLSTSPPWLEATASFLRAVDTFLFIMDPELHTGHFISGAFERVYGGQPDRFLASPAVLAEIVHPDDLPVASELILSLRDAALRPQLPAGGLLQRSEIRLIDKRGNIVWNEFICSAIEVADGSRFIMGLALDDTRRHQSDAVIDQLSTASTEATRSTADFLSKISHELRTPLHAMLGYAQLLEMGAGDPQDFLPRLRRAGNHVVQLLDDLLDFSRLVAGRLTLEIESVPVARGQSTTRSS